MKKFTYILLILVVTFAGLWLARKQIYQLVVTRHPNQEMPDFQLQDLDGGRIDFADYRGKLLVLDFWTTWCGACKQAFPDFQELAAKYEPNEDVMFLAVNSSHGGDSIDKVRAYMKNSGYTFPVAFDSAAVLSDRLGIKYYPTLMIVDATGTIRIKHVGYSKSLEDYQAVIERHIEKLLAEGAGPSSKSNVDLFLNLSDHDFSKKLSGWLNALIFTKIPLHAVCRLEFENGVKFHCRFLHRQNIET